ncbi:hypothetical protein [Nostoc sp.]|uniref:hypothetical protein n=1 Tax=Nostoc sp. TaxID=1180 RepID=UPI002FFC6F6B
MKIGRSLGLENLRSPFYPFQKYFLMITQTSTPTPTKDPLTTQDRQIIATIVNQLEYSKNCQPEDVVTIWINSDYIVWVKMTHSYARYHKESFKCAVAEIKPIRNSQLHATHLCTCCK